MDLGAEYVLVAEAHGAGVDDEAQVLGLADLGAQGPGGLERAGGGVVDGEVTVARAL